MSQQQVSKPGLCDAQPCRVGYPTVKAAQAAVDRAEELNEIRYRTVYCTICGMWHAEPVSDERRNA